MTEQRKEYLRRYYHKTKDRYRERNRVKWQVRYKKNKESILRRLREYHKMIREKFPERIQAQKKRWYSKHKPKIQEYLRGYYTKNRNRIRAASKARYENKKPLILEQMKEYNRIHPEVQRNSQKRNRVKNRPKYKAYAAKYRALKMRATVNLDGIKKWMERVRDGRIATCYWCQKVIPSELVHFDHIIPLSRGGEHSVRNLCVSCQHCNQSKSGKSIRAWIKTGQQVLEL